MQHAAINSTKYSSAVLKLYKKENFFHTDATEYDPPL